MSDTLFNVIFAWKCSSTHHKLAMDALNQLQGAAAVNWRDMCLAQIGPYLEGAKAPDDQFKDFRNHVLHVREGLWGGAMTAASHWYRETVSALRGRDWKEAAFSAGVLSHYYSDPLMPFHTGQSEAEGIVHRAAEWSIACAYRELTDLLETQLGGWPQVELPTGRNWLETMVADGARAANPHYEFCIDHYDIRVGARNPPAGLDQPLRECLARLLGRAVVGYARIMERALAEAAVEIPASNLTLQNVVSRLTIPVAWVTRKLKDARDRAAVQAIYNEFQATGKVIAALPEGEKFIRKVHAQEVLQKPLAELDREMPRPVGTAHVREKVLPVMAAAPAAATSPVTEPEAPSVVAPVVHPAPAIQRVDAPHDIPRPHIPITAVAEAPPTAEVAPAAVEPPAPAAVETAPAAVVPPESAPAAEPPVTTLPLVAPLASPAASLTGTPDAGASSGKFYLTSDMPIEKAPSIGPKTAKTLERRGVHTVADLLAVEPEQLAMELGDRRLDADTIQDWKWQAQLCCTVPQLRGHDAQFLVACEIRSAAELASASAQELFARVDQFVSTSAGQRILRDGQRPNLAEVIDWIAKAGQGASRRAA